MLPAEIRFLGRAEYFIWLEIDTVAVKPRNDTGCFQNSPIVHMERLMTSKQRSITTFRQLDHDAQLRSIGFQMLVTRPFRSPN